MKALDETLLAAVPPLLDAWDLAKTVYEVFLQSARHELNNLVRNNHARAISRIGFAAQDMKDFEYEARLAIQDQALEKSAECIQTAERELSEAIETGGDVITNGARQLQTLNNALADYTIYYTIDELHLVLAVFDTEFLYLFAYFNSVNYLYGVVGTYQLEVQVFFSLFDYFVEEVLFDMIVYNTATNQYNQNIFTSLIEGSEEFRVQSNTIVNSLIQCD